MAVIRPAVAGDAKAVAALIDAAYGHYVARIGKKPGPMLDDYPARIAAGEVWVCGEPIEGVLVLEDAEGALLLDNIAVSPAVQGKGVGRALMAFAEAEALARGYRAIRLYTHVMMVENIAIYSRVGYSDVGRVEEKGFSRVYMEKGLG